MPPVPAQKTAEAPALFKDVPEYKILEILTSGASNNFWKATILLAMEEGKAYIGSTLNGDVDKLLEGAFHPNSPGKLFGLCKYLNSVGLVEERNVTVESRHKSRLMPAYEITAEGSTLARASVLRFLLVADYLEKSLNEINGATNTPGPVTRAYSMARMLEILHDQQPLTVRAISDATSSERKDVENTLKHLSDLGLVEYESLDENEGPYKVKITDKGIVCFELAYGPAIQVAKDPTSSYACGDFREVFKDPLVNVVFKGRALTVNELLNLEGQRSIAHEKQRSVSASEGDQLASDAATEESGVVVSDALKKMTPQQITEALLSGASNNFWKAAMLYVMEPGKAYTGSLLNAAVKAFLGGAFHPKFPSTLSELCRSMASMGIMKEKLIITDGSTTSRPVTAFEITEDLGALAKQSILRFLSVANYLDRPLAEINGVAYTPGSVTRAYLMAKTLEVLYAHNLHDQQPMTLKNIADALSLKGAIVVNALRQLDRIGLAKYSGVGKSKLGGSVAVLNNPERLDYYLSNFERCKQAVLKNRPNFARWRDLKAALEWGPRELDCNTLSEKLNVSTSNTSTVVAALCDRDVAVYRYKDYTGGGIVKSQVKITAEGKVCFEFAYGQILRLAQALASSDSTTMDLKNVFEDPLIHVVLKGHALTVNELFNLEGQRSAAHEKRRIDTGVKNLIRKEEKESD